MANDESIRGQKKALGQVGPWDDHALSLLLTFTYGERVVLKVVATSQNPNLRNYAQNQELWATTGESIPSSVGDRLHVKVEGVSCSDEKIAAFFEECSEPSRWSQTYSEWFRGTFSIDTSAGDRALLFQLMNTPVGSDPILLALVLDGANRLPLGGVGWYRLSTPEYAWPHPESCELVLVDQTNDPSRVAPGDWHHLLQRYLREE